MKNKPVISGIIAAASPIVGLCGSAFTASFAYVLGIEMHYDVLPIGLKIFALLPFAISMVFVVLGVIHGIVKRKEKLAWLGILLSVIGLLMFAMVSFLLYDVATKH